MWGIIPAAGSGTRIQPLAFSKELLPVGSRREGGIERPRAVSEYLVERMLAGGADQALLRDLARQVRHPALLRRRDRRRQRRLRRSSRGRRPVRRHLPRPAADRPRRERGDRPARHDLVPGGRASRPSTGTGSPSCCSRSSIRSCSTPWRPRRTGGCERIWVKSARGALALDLGRDADAGRGAARAARAVAASASGSDEYLGTLVTPGSPRGGEASGRARRHGLCRCRHAARLPRGARAAAGRRAASRRRVWSRVPDDGDGGRSRASSPAACASSGPGSTTATWAACWTAPDHFLGDYPAVKWQRFAARAARGPERPDGARHRLQRRLLRDRDEAARGRRGWWRIDSDPDYLAQARFAAEVSGLEIEFRAALGLRRGRAGRALRPRAVHGRALPPAPPAAGARPDPRARRPRPAGVPVDAARQRRGRAGRRRTTRFFDVELVRAAGLPDAALHRAPLRRRSDQLVDARTGPASRPCCAAPASQILAHPEEEVFVCRRRELELRPRRPARGLSRAGSRA